MKRPVFGLPLTAKDLLEAAQRRRTYLVRVLAGILLAVVFCITWFNLDRRGGGNLLGSGRELLQAITLLLCWVTAIIAPAACSAAIAGERESGSLPLLQMTMLGPMTIVLEKWLSRLVPLLGLVLIAAPLMALAYAFGGFEPAFLISAIGAAAVTAIQATAVAICASAWCRGTIGALLLGYVLLAALYGIPAMIRHSGDPLSAPLAFANLDSGSGWGVPSGARQVQFNLTCAWSILSALIALVLARFALARRTQPASGNRLLTWFRGLDRLFERLERARFGRVVARELPRDRPVAWRECHRRTLTSPRYLARILVVVAGLTVTVIVLAIAAAGFSEYQTIFGIASTVLFSALCLGLVVLGSTAFSAERSNETLPVLLTTPMPATSILAQKISGLRRVHAAGIFLLGGLIAIRVWFCPDQATWNYQNWPWWLSLTGVIVTPAVLTWTAVLVGLVVRTRARAITMAISVVLGWIVAGSIIAVLLSLAAHEGGPPVSFAVLNPVALTVANDLESHAWPKPVPALLGYLAFHLLLWLLLRRLAFAFADRLLRRSTTS